MSHSIDNKDLLSTSHSLLIVLMHVCSLCIKRHPDLSSASTITPAQQGRWSSPSATPQRKTGFSSPFTPAGSCTSYLTFSSQQLSTIIYCDVWTPAEPWQPAPRTVLTRMFPSSCCPTRRPPPREEQPPRRGTSTQNSMRGETKRWHVITEAGVWRSSLTAPVFSFFPERFDFDFSLEESTQRRLELSVKNSVSFMSRERELIGKVSVSSFVSEVQLAGAFSCLQLLILPYLLSQDSFAFSCPQLQLDLDQIDLKTGVTQW